MASRDISRPRLSVADAADERLNQSHPAAFSWALVDALLNQKQSLQMNKTVIGSLLADCFLRLLYLAKA